jgi:hypothetical protein
MIEYKGNHKYYEIEKKICKPSQMMLMILLLIF